MPATDASQGNAADTETVSSPTPAKFRYATKTALSLTLAYLIPMSMGWPQPSTAATTVMLIAATGLLSESLQKGVLRVLGTVAGAILGLCLIALFPQDRMVYLLAASIVVALIIYLYNAYQGDSTVFMLTAVVTLMVFNGGDAEGAFLYGVDRAFMTAFGVIVYTLVASILWPVKTADNTRALAAGVAHDHHRAFSRLINPDAEEQPIREQVTELLAGGSAFQTHFATVKNSADGVTDYLAEWNTVLSCYEELEATLVPALQQTTRQQVAFSQHIDNYPSLIEQIEAMFQRVESAWQGQPGAGTVQPIEIQYNADSLRQATHLTSAAVATRAEVLERMQTVLVDLQAAMDSLLFDGGNFARRQPRGRPAFVWLDRENVKTAVRAFTTFWIATAIWIQFNPPGGFMFVTMCTIFIPLVSYTPVTPKLLYILFTLGFLFALPAYVFLLPQMNHWLELAAFIFSYAFIGFFLFQGPVSIFFLLGLFTLGIQNTMSYNVDAILLIILMFYLVCTLLIIAIHFPFTSKPERIYQGLRRRFFKQSARLLQAYTTPAGPLSPLLRPGDGEVLLTKMHSWGARIDGSYFPANGQQSISALNNACDLLHGQIKVLALREQAFATNPLIARARLESNQNPLATLCESLASGAAEEPFEQVKSRLTGIEQRLDEFLEDDYLDRYDRLQLAQFYIYLNLLASIMGSLNACREALVALDWQQLGETRF